MPQFLQACEAEGFSLQTVYRAAPSAPAPVELYEFSKGGREGFRGVPVAENDSALHEESASGDDGGVGAGLVSNSDGAAVGGSTGGDADEGEVGSVSEEAVSEGTAR